MRRRTRGRPRALSIPASSMADVAFLLLVFFLIVSSIPWDRGLSVVIPESPGDNIRATRIEEGADSIMSLNLPTDYSYWDINKQNILHVVVRDRSDIELCYGNEFRKVSSTGLRRADHEFAKTHPRLIVNLRTAPLAPYDAMIQALDELHAAGVRRISIGQLGRGGILVTRNYDRPIEPLSSCPESVIAP